MQQDLFDQSNGDNLKANGIDQVLSNTPASYQANFEAVVYRFPYGKLFTSEDITRIVGQPPNHPNTVGALISSLAKRGIIVPTGTRSKALRANQHSAKLEIWKKV